MKKFAQSFILALICLTLFATMAAAAQDITINVNGQKVSTDVAPYIKDSRTLVPIRFVAEALGAQVGWEGEAKKVIIKSNATDINLWIDKNNYTVNGVTKTMDTVPEIRSSRTMVPLRFVAEAMGAEVKWDGKTYTVDIYYNAPAAQNKVELLADLGGQGTGDIRSLNEIYTLSSGELLLNIKEIDDVGNHNQIVSKFNVNSKALKELVRGDLYFRGYGVSSQGEVLYSDKTNDLYKVDTAGTVTRLTDTPSIIEEFPDWSRNGDKIVYKAVKGKNYLATMKSDGSNQQILESMIIIDSAPCWAPNGQSIAYTLYSGKDRGLWITDSRGNSKKRIVEAFDLKAPVFSPDGSKIMASGIDKFIIVNNDGTGLMQKEGKNPVWSSDGTKVAFTKNNQLWLWNLSDGKMSPLADKNADCLTWSEDGRAIYFAVGGKIYMVAI